MSLSHLDTHSLILPPAGKSIPTELRSEATELQKKMKYDDADREGLFLIWKCST